MEAQKKEYDKALAALESARDNVKKTLKGNADFLAKVQAPAEKPASEMTTLDASETIQSARNALQSGDTHKSAQALERAREIILALKDGGKEYGFVLEDLARQANEVAVAVAKTQEGEAQTQADTELNKLLELQGIAKSLESIKIGVDQAAAEAALKTARDALQGFADANPVVFKAIVQAQDQALLNANYKAPEAKAAGGPITGPGPVGVDSQLIMAAPGEHMLTAREVAAAGGHGAIYRLRQALLSGALKGYAQGGPIAARSSVLRAVSALPDIKPARPSSQDWPHLGRIDLSLGGMESYPVYAEADVAAVLKKTISREALKRGGRR